MTEAKTEAPKTSNDPPEFTDADSPQQEFDNFLVQLMQSLSEATAPTTNLPPGAAQAVMKHKRAAQLHVERMLGVIEGYAGGLRRARFISAEDYERMERTVTDLMNTIRGMPEDAKKGAGDAAVVAPSPSQEPPSSGSAG